MVGVVVGHFWEVQEFSPSPRWAKLKTEITKKINCLVVGILCHALCNGSDRITLPQ